MLDGKAYYSAKPQTESQLNLVNIRKLRQRGNAISGYRAMRAGLLVLCLDVQVHGAPAIELFLLK